MLKLFVFIVSGILLFSGSYLKSDGESFKNVLKNEIKKHPQLQAEDLYKFINQASFGSEHAVKDTVAVRKWMTEEIQNLDFTIEDELIDILSPDSNIVRVNLCPYIKNGYDPDMLVDAFIKTANTYQGSKEKFIKYWKAAEELSAEGYFPFTKIEMNKLYEGLSAKGFPAIHHSKKYEEDYKPAYRVIESRYLPELLKK